VALSHTKVRLKNNGWIFNNIFGSRCTKSRDGFVRISVTRKGVSRETKKDERKGVGGTWKGRAGPGTPISSSSSSLSSSSSSSSYFIEITQQTCMKNTFRPTS